MLVFSVFKSKVVCGWVLIATVLSHYWPIVGLILLATMTLVWLTPSDVAEALSLFDNPYVDGDEARIKYNNIKTVFEERMKEHNIRKQKSYQRKNVKNENKK